MTCCINKNKPSTIPLRIGYCQSKEHNKAKGDISDSIYL